MTNGLGLFLVFYILVGQPALLGRMMDNYSLYQLALLNAGVFIVAWLISILCKPNKQKIQKDNTAKVIEKSEEKISRIENDNGVAVVSVEKKQEVVVETSKSEDPEPIAEGLVENNEEKSEETIEEKLEEKMPERPMRENVTIPKIVQPLSGHQNPKKRKKDLKWGQWVVLLITLGLVAIIAWTLWEFLENRGIGISLFLGWILYLVIGKLFDIDGFYNAKKLFTNWLYIALIIAGICYGIYTSQDDASFNLIKNQAVSYVKDRFGSEKEDNLEIGTGNMVYVFEGTGEVVAQVEDNEILTETGLVENEEKYIEISTGILETGNLEEVQSGQMVEIEDQTSMLSDEEAKKQVTMGEAIKSLVGGSTLSTKTNVSFKYVSKSNELYPYFKTAQEKWMIGTDTDPSKIVSCETYITMKGIREGRNVGNYSKDNVKSVYWNKATELGKLNGCEKGKYVTKGNL